MHDGDGCHAHQGGVGFCFVGGGEFISCEKEQLQSHQQEAQQQLQQCLSQSLRLHPKMALRQKCWAPQWIEGTGKNIIDQYLLWCDLQLLSSESRPASNQVQSANSPPLVTTQTWDWERERMHFFNHHKNYMLHQSVPAVTWNLRWTDLVVLCLCA